MLGLSQHGEEAVQRLVHGVATEYGACPDGQIDEELARGLVVGYVATTDRFAVLVVEPVGHPGHISVEQVIDHVAHRVGVGPFEALAVGENDAGILRLHAPVPRPEYAALRVARHLRLLLRRGTFSEVGSTVLDLAFLDTFQLTTANEFRIRRRRFTTFRTSDQCVLQRPQALLSEGLREFAGRPGAVVETDLSYVPVAQELGRQPALAHAESKRRVLVLLRCPLFDPLASSEDRLRLGHRQGFCTSVFRHLREVDL